LEYVACNLCGTDAPSPYCKVGDFQIVRCGACGLFYTNPRRPAEEVAEFYSEDYFTSGDPSTLGYDDYSIHEEGLKHVFSDNLSIIERYLRPPASIIDIGCAFGYFIQVAASRGWIADGIEVSKFASQRACENTESKIFTGKLSEANLPDTSYDSATMWDMLEHSSDPVAELRETNRILKPDAYLFMTVPNAGSFPARLMGTHWYGFKSAAEHNYFFTEATLDRLLSKTGFRLLESRRGTWPCSLKFMASKLAPYSESASRVADRIIKLLGAERMIVKFKFIDIFVVAQKYENAC
jgi:SAM-dependent methyltransferase